MACKPNREHRADAATAAQNQRQLRHEHARSRSADSLPNNALRHDGHTPVPLLDHLNRRSVPYADPLTTLHWPSLSLGDYWLPPHAISLHGIEEFEAMPEATRKRLSQFEFAGFIQAGLWLEALFMERLSQGLRNTVSAPEHAYRLHEIREEAGHSLMFLQFLQECGLALPRNETRRSRAADLIGRHAPINGPLFWLAVVIGEELPNRLNRQLRRNGTAHVNPVIIQMCTLHSTDEARHIAHARDALARRLENAGHCQRRVLAMLATTLLRQSVRIFYVPPAWAYERAGLASGIDWQRRARNNPARQAFVAQCVKPTLSFLSEHGLRIHLPGW
ncbi:MAG: diiron oxygenase [Betaproteobacteria bacterium]|nr:diiron oxygenase [Betaproteobacteria bacterium]